MWFTETPWPPIAILGLIAAGFLLAAMQTQAAKWLVAVAVCLLLGIAVWFIEKAVITPGEQVEAHVFAIVQAFQKNDEPGTLKFISPASVGLVALAQAGIKVVDLKEGYSVSDMQIKTLANKTAATSHFRVNGTISMPTQGNLGHKPFRFNGKWRIEAGEWRLTEIEELDPISGEVLNRFDQLR